MTTATSSSFWCPVPRPNAKACRHKPHTPVFDAEAAKGLSDTEIRRLWPRFFGACSLCGESTIIYASWAHYIQGDW